MTLGYVIVALSTIGGFFINPAVGIGLAILAGFRLYVLRRELRRQAADESDDSSTSASRKSIARTAAGRAS
jgi:hypothetical protein